MDLPAASWHDILNLVSGTGADDQHLGPALTELVVAVQAAVPSYRGARVTIVIDDQTVQLNTFPDPDDATPIGASLRLPMAAVLTEPSAGGVIDHESNIVFYATTPGAFVDLAADLQYAVGRQPTIDGHHPNHQIAVDADLSDVPAVSGRLTGLDEISTINRAVGILIDQGHPPDQAHTELRHRAAAAGLSVHHYAAHLLRR